MQVTVFKGVQAAGAAAVLGVLLSLGFSAWLPSYLVIWGMHVPRFVGLFLIPVVGLVLSGFLSLIVSCDPHLVDHSSNSRAAIWGVVILPSVFAVPVHAVALWSNARHEDLGITPWVFLSGLLLIYLGVIFRYVEQNYVVGIRDVWTLRSSEVWEDTHRWAAGLFVIFGVVGLVLTWFVPAGLLQIVTIVGLFVVPSAIAVVYSYIIRSDRYQYIVR